MNDKITYPLTYVPISVLVQRQFGNDRVYGVEARGLYSNDKLVTYNIDLCQNEYEDNFRQTINVGEMIEIHFDDDDYIIVPKTQHLFIAKDENPIASPIDEIEKVKYFLDPDKGQRDIRWINKYDIGPVLYYTFSSSKNKNHFQISKNGKNILLGDNPK